MSIVSVLNNGLLISAKTGRRAFLTFLTFEMKLKLSETRRVLPMTRVESCLLVGCWWRWCYNRRGRGGNRFAPDSHSGT